MSEHTECRCHVERGVRQWNRKRAVQDEPIIGWRFFLGVPQECLDDINPAVIDGYILLSQRPSQAPASAAKIQQRLAIAQTRVLKYFRFFQSELLILSPDG